MRSFKSYIYQWAFHRYGRITSGNDKVLLRYISKTLNFSPTRQIYKKFNVEQIEVNGYPCFIVKPKDISLHNKKIVYLHGGGISNKSPHSIGSSLVVRLIKQVIHSMYLFIHFVHQRTILLMRI